MKSILRTLVLAPAVLAVAAFSATSAMASATVKVPFNFTVNGKICPAGTYSVDRNPTTHIVRLNGVDNTESFNWVLGPSNVSVSENKVILKFDDADSGHALKYVQFGAESTSALDQAKKHSHHSSAPAGEGK